MPIWGQERTIRNNGISGNYVHIIDQSFLNISFEFQYQYSEQQSYVRSGDGNLEEHNEKASVREESRSLLLIAIRVIICLLLIAAAGAVKLIGGEIHAQVGTWFYDNYNNTIFTDEKESTPPFADQVSVTESSLINDQYENKNG